MSKMHHELIEITTNDDPSEFRYEDGISRLDKPVEYGHFFQHHLLPNRPCIFGKFITENWKSRTVWVTGNKPNWKCLRESFGEAEVPVAHCDQREYNAQKKTISSLNDYLDYWREYIQEGYCAESPCLYLKDWHLTRDFPDADIYRVPKYFASDWVNEYFTKRKDVNDDYRFVYMGPRGTWTPLHVDVFTSFSWSVNIVGKKRWLFFPPGQETYLKDRLGNLAYDATSSELQDSSLYPHFKNLQKSYDIIQEAGEAIFVPSGWHHQVWNLDDTISINHNWINGCNIGQMWTGLQMNLTAVQREVSDCRDMDDWESHCQLMLRASYGMNYEEFYDMLFCVAEPRISQLEGKGGAHQMYGGWTLGLQHAAWDLRQVLIVLTSLLEDPDTNCLEWVEVKNPSYLRERIVRVLENTSVLAV